MWGCRAFFFGLACHPQAHSQGLSTTVRLSFHASSAWSCCEINCVEYVRSPAERSPPYKNEVSRLTSAKVQYALGSSWEKGLSFGRKQASYVGMRGCSYHMHRRAKACAVEWMDLFGAIDPCPCTGYCSEDLGVAETVRTCTGYTDLVWPRALLSTW